MGDHTYQQTMFPEISDEKLIQLEPTYEKNEERDPLNSSMMNFLCNTSTNTQKGPVLVVIDEHSNANAQIEQNSTTNEIANEQSTINTERIKSVGAPMKVYSFIDSNVELDPNVYCSQVIMKEYESEDTAGELKTLLESWSMQDLYPFFIREFFFCVLADYFFRLFRFHFTFSPYYLFFFLIQKTSYMLSFSCN